MSDYASKLQSIVELSHEYLDWSFQDIKKFQSIVLGQRNNLHRMSMHVGEAKIEQSNKYWLWSKF